MVGELIFVSAPKEFEKDINKILLDRDSLCSKQSEDLLEIAAYVKELILINQGQQYDYFSNDLSDSALSRAKENGLNQIAKIDMNEPRGLETLHQMIQNDLDTLIDLRERPAMRSQYFYMARMQATGYDINMIGMCFGLSHMAMQAFLADDMKTFNERLQAIYTTPVEDFKNDFQSLREKQKQLLAEGKKNDANEITKKIVDMLAFFDGIALYNDTDNLKYRSIFKDEDGVFLFDDRFIDEEQKDVLPQDSEKVMPLVLPLKLEDEGKAPAEIGPVSGRSYSKLLLRDQLSQFQSKLGTHTFSLILSAEMYATNGGGHSINLNYDCTTKQWLLIDPNFLPGVTFNDFDKLTDAIFQAYRMKEESDELNMRSMGIYTSYEHGNKMQSTFNNERLTKTPLESFLMDYKDANENGAAVIKDSLSSQNNLALIIPGRFALKEILQKVKEEDQSMLIYALGKDIIEFIPDVETYLDLFSILKPAGHAALIASQGAHLRSISSNITDLYPHEISCLEIALNDLDKAQSIISELDRLSSGALLPEIDAIKTSNHLNEVMLLLLPEQCTALLTGIKEQLPEIIKTAEDVSNVMRFLSPEQCTVLLSAIKEQLPDIIKKSDKKWYDRMDHLPPEQRIKLFNAMQGDFSGLIKKQLQFQRALNYYPSEQKCLIIDELKNELAGIIKSSDGMGMLIDKVSFSPETLLVLLKTIQDVSPCMLTSENAYEDIIGWLGSEDSNLFTEQYDKLYQGTS